MKMDEKTEIELEALMDEHYAVLLEEVEQTLKETAAREVWVQPVNAYRVTWQGRSYVATYEDDEDTLVKVVDLYAFERSLTPRASADTSEAKDSE